MSTADQITLLTEDIEDSFWQAQLVRPPSAKKDDGVVLVNLTAPYDTVWHRGLTCKFLPLLPERHIVYMIMKLVGNRGFTLTTGNSKWSRLRLPKNGVHRDPS